MIPVVPANCALIVLSVTDLMSTYTATYAEVAASAEVHIANLAATDGTPL